MVSLALHVCPTELSNMSNRQGKALLKKPMTFRWDPELESFLFFCQSLRRWCHVTNQRQYYTPFRWTSYCIDARRAGVIDSNGVVVEVAGNPFDEAGLFPCFLGIHQLLIAPGFL